MNTNTSASSHPTEDGLPTGPARVERLTESISAIEVFERLSGRPHCLFLDSAMRRPQLGRYSFVAADPFQVIECAPGDMTAFSQLRFALSKFKTQSLGGLPPFQGGAAGLLSYDLNRTLERCPIPQRDEFRLPAMHVGFYDTLAAFDHETDESWIISQGFPELDPQARRERAEARIAEFRHWIAGNGGPSKNERSLAVAERHTLRPDPELDAAILSTNFNTPNRGVLSNFEARGYRKIIEQGVEFINAGDVFQVNLAQRLLHRASGPSTELYLRLRSRNPATFAGYYDCGPHQIISASPERFLCLRGDRLETRPIKGTRPRTKTPEADLFAASDLRSSEKDRAENVMIVDLLRNDLSRVCRADSVKVEQLCQLEAYEYVQHLVSAVSGRLAEGVDAVAAIEAAFPGGSITGAPKVRAMEIIAELEQTARGPYCGSLGYLGFDGAMDLSILIRTATASRGWWQFPVGGGIVSQSTPENEYQETWHKAAGMLRALHD